MIGKKIPNPKAASSKPGRIGGLADYIDRPENADREEKCIYSNGLNFEFESEQAQRAEMIALALEAPKSKDPVDHYVLSWKEGEQPTEAQCDEAAKILLERLGVPDHQCRYALHQDTDNYHMHVLVNRVNPETEQVKHIEYPVNKLHESLAVIEHRQGWERQNRALYVVNENGEPVRAADERTQEATVSAKANAIEARTGERSAERIAIEEAAPVMRQAKSWAELHAQLGERGIGFETKGSGAILRVGGQPVKASSAGRDCSLAALQKRLGPFQPPARQVEVQNRAPEPVKPGAPAWSEYAKQRREHFEHKNEVWTELRARHAAERKKMSAGMKAQREQIQGRATWKNAPRGARIREARNAARSALAARHAGQRAELRARHAAERQQLQKSLGRFPTYEEWLAKRDPEQAQQWRYRQADNQPEKQSIIGDRADAQLTARDIRSFTATVDQKHGRVLYSRAGERTAGFVDRGKAIDVNNWKDRDTTLAALQLAAEKWGGKFQINGNDEYKQLCVKLAVENGWKITNPELQQAIEREKAAQQNRPAPARPEPARAEKAQRAPARTNEEIYNRHRDNIRARVPGPVEPSRLDWMIANRMRATGHTPKRIEETIRTCAAKQRPDEKRDWGTYAKRTTEAVFGERGNREQGRLGKYVDTWKRLEGRDPQQERQAQRPAKQRERERSQEWDMER